MKVNMDDLLLDGLLDNDDELILLSQDVPSFEKGFCLYLPDLSMETYKENLQVANLFHSQPN